MATLLQIQETMPDNLKKQLAIAVRSIQWSYAIFWSISAGEPSVLVWGDGYYNGDIKTRKTIQSIEFNADQMGLERSEQLKELYESLSAGEANPQARRPSASLSPEDLSDAEWYYLVCMSFIFNIDEGLPGRTLAKAKPIWLCNAPFADSKVFSRSLLAKSASIKTVVCFPFLGGVIELGTTDLVREDPSLIQHVKSSYLEIHPLTMSNTRNDKKFACAGLDQDLLSTKLVPVVEQNEQDMDSPKSSSNGLEPIQLASQVQSWQFMDDELSNCVHDSMDSSDCISQTLVSHEKVVSVSGTKDDHLVSDRTLQNLKELNHTKLNSLELQSDRIHYQGILSALLKSSHQLILRPNHQNCHQKSSFISWKKRRFVKFPKPRSGISQIVLKKVLFEVPKMHIGRIVDSPEDNEDYKVGLLKPEAEEVPMNHALSERKRGEKLHERFSILRTLVPSATKDDKVSILDAAIEYLKELETRVEDLESCRESTQSEPTMKRKQHDTKEGTSDNYGNKKLVGVKKAILNKRKVCDILDEKEPERNCGVSVNNSTENITVSVKSRDVLIEIRCSWRDRVLLEIMDALSKTNLDSHSVQSSTKDGILFLTIKSKYKGPTVASARIIKKTLEKIV